MSRSVYSCDGESTSVRRIPTPGPARLDMVRVFAKWLQGIDPRTEVPPAGHICAKLRRTRPYIYADGQVASIVTEAGRLPTPYGLRG
jgi:integrase/recombinase XerD